jgi:hypothetical protein
MRVKHAEKLEEVQIASWRRDRLAEAGFPLPLAARVAADVRFDLHALIELAELGCAPELAVRILAPLEGDGSLP